MTFTIFDTPVTPTEFGMNAWQRGMSFDPTQHSEFLDTLNGDPKARESAMTEWRAGYMELAETEFFDIYF